MAMKSKCLKLALLLLLGTVAAILCSRLWARKTAAPPQGIPDHANLSAPLQPERKTLRRQVTEESDSSESEDAPQKESAHTPKNDAEFPEFPELFRERVARIRWIVLEGRGKENVDAAAKALADLSLDLADYDGPELEDYLAAVAATEPSALQSLLIRSLCFNRKPVVCAWLRRFLTESSDPVSLLSALMNLATFRPDDPMVSEYLAREREEHKSQGTEWEFDLRSFVLSFWREEQVTDGFWNALTKPDEDEYDGPIIVCTNPTFGTTHVLCGFKLRNAEDIEAVAQLLRRKEFLDRVLSPGDGFLVFLDRAMSSLPKEAFKGGELAVFLLENAEYWWLRREAVCKLGYAGLPEPPAALVKAVADEPDERVREAAATILGCWSTPAARNTLLSVLYGDTSRECKKRALGALSALSIHRDFLPQVHEWVRAQDDEYLRHYLRCVVNQRGMAFLPRADLFGWATHPVTGVRRLVVEALGLMGDEECVSLLRKLAGNDPSAGVRSYAEDYLRRLTKKK